MAKEIKPTVYRDPMELSQLSLLGSQVDIEKFSVIMHHSVGIKLADAITDAKVSRTMSGSSILVVTVNDPERNLLQSGNFQNKMDVEIDGLWWRFKSLNKSQDSLELTFEEREVAILRLYTKPTPLVSRQKFTRAEFILKLLKEVKEIDIPYWIPELYEQQPIFNSNDVAISPLIPSKGINPKEKLTVKGTPARPDQIKNGIDILNTGNAVVPMTLARRRKILVCALMTAIQENSLTNSPFVKSNASSGTFQQIRDEGWPASGDVATDAKAFFKAAIHEDAVHPTESYNDLCYNVQHPLALYKDRYGPHQQEAEEWVTSWGMPGNDMEGAAAAANQSNAYTNVSSGNFSYYRGTPPSRKNMKWGPESSWDCIQRLATDVNWRAFFVSGIFYYLSEDELFKTQPKAIFGEYDDGIDWIDGDYDANKKTASVSVTLRMGRYGIPPGCIVKLRDMGPFNGRWLVETVERNMYDPSGTLSLKKPDPALAEPLNDQLSNTQRQAFSGNTPIVPGTTPQIPFTEGGVIGMAKKILQYANKGKYRSESATGDDVAQWRKVADGQPWASPCGYPVVCDPKLAQILLFLLDAGWSVATSALCEDHNCHVAGTDRISEHAQGKGMDIHSIGRDGMGWGNIGFSTSLLTIQWVETMMTQLVIMNPSQIICEGTGGQYVQDILDLQYNNGKVGEFYHLGDHRNHIHVGV